VPRKAEGGAFEDRGKLFARVTVAPKKREAVLVPTCATLFAAHARARKIQALVDRLRETGHQRGIEKTIEEAWAADDQGMRRLEQSIERIVTGKEPPPWDRPAIAVDSETFEAFAMMGPR